MISSTRSCLYLVVVFVIVFLTSPSASYECFDPINPFEISNLRECSPKSDSYSKLSSGQQFRNWNYTNTNATDDNAFELSFTCDPTMDDKTCQKAHDSFVKAGKLLSKVFKFPQKVTVAAEFADLCKTIGGCDQTGTIGKFKVKSCCTTVEKLRSNRFCNIYPLLVGAASPSRFFSMTGEDGAIRLYPQILTKLANPKGSVPFDTHDIVASFNSKLAPNFFFPGDKNIKSDQVDFTGVIAHEFLHGLGFYSSWEPVGSFSDVVTPFFIVDNGNKLRVRETIFDQFVIRTADGKKLTDYTAAIEKAIDGQTYTTDADLKNSIETVATSIGLTTTTDYITPNAIGFLPKGRTNTNDAVILETTLKPFSTGSTGSHVDKATYEKTPDWLMIYEVIVGKTFQQIDTDNGAATPGAIVGPNIKAIMESIG